MAPESAVAAKPSKSHKDKSEKKHKSKSKEDKKRKREHGEDGEKRKSKKHRKTKQEETLKSSNQADTPVQNSPFHTQTSSLYLPLSPISQRQPLEGICAEHLSPLVLTYYPPLRGVVLSYSNPWLAEKPFQNDGSESLLKCIDEYGVSFAWVTADFLLFRPERGGELEGYVNLQNEGHLGLVCWNLFNASIERQRLPKDWTWVGVEGAEETEEYGNYNPEGVGYYINGRGDKIEGTVKFKVKHIESSHDHDRGFLSIEGTMLEEAEEEGLLEKEVSTSTKHVLGSGQRQGGSRALGATRLGQITESNAEGMDIDGGPMKHRRKY